ncbi:MAG TPA: SWIM zinc finger family protein [Polyangiaceae bacterium]|nr:SWIM zinc finger family protein [Polyangiaceae bacterium]
MSRYSSRYSGDRFPPYVPVAQRARDAAAAVAKLKKKGHVIEPVAIDGRVIASTFWGKAWCSHLESLSDYQSRLPRGRTYVRRGAVVHLALDSGSILAKVQGSSLYDVKIEVVKLKSKRWSSVVAQCTGNIDSLVELLRGKLSEGVMRAVTNVETGLFPLASEIEMSCSCQDWAGLCKHLAAVLYGVGARLDTRPELLFTLRGVDPSELVGERAASAIPGAKTNDKRSRRVLPSSGLSDVFGIEFEAAPAAREAQKTKSPQRPQRVPAEPSAASKKTSKKTR